MTRSKCNEQGQVLHQFLKCLPESLGRSSGFVQRRSKMSSPVFLQTVLLGWLHHSEASLQELCHWSRALGVEISPQGLDKRFNQQAVELFKGVLAEALQHFQQQQGLPAELLRQFSGIHILDSTYIVVPDALQATFKGSGGKGAVACAKIQLSFDYLRGCIQALELQSAHIPDQKATLHSQLANPGSLHLFDLGYFKVDVFRALDNKGAYFISRLNTQCLLYSALDAEKALDLPTYLSSLSGERHETTLYMSAQRLPVRILFEKLPEQVASERRRKAKRRGKRSQKPRTQRHLDLLSWSIFITNVPQTMLTFPQVLLLYRVRWQIELLFKLWKSQLQLANIGHSWRSERVLCQLYAKMILMILFQWLVAPYRLLAEGQLSLVKAFQVLQRYHVPALLRCIRNPRHTFHRWVQDFLNELTLFAKKSRQKTAPSTFQALLLAELPA